MSGDDETAQAPSVAAGASRSPAWGFAGPRAADGVESGRTGSRSAPHGGCCRRSSAGTNDPVDQGRLGGMHQGALRGRRSVGGSRPSETFSSWPGWHHVPGMEQDWRPSQGGALGRRAVDIDRRPGSGAGQRSSDGSTAKRRGERGQCRARDSDRSSGGHEADYVRQLRHQDRRGVLGHHVEASFGTGLRGRPARLLPRTDGPGQRPLVVEVLSHQPGRASGTKLLDRAHVVAAVLHEYRWRGLRRQGVPLGVLRTMRGLYRSGTAQVIR